MMEWVGALVWPAVAVYAIWRAAGIADRYAPAPPPSLDQLADAAIPPDLVGLAHTYPDTWAQEDILKVIRERYDELRDWNKVRRAMGVAPDGSHA